MEVDLRDIEVRPRGELHGLPFAEGLEAELEQPFGLVLLRRDKPNDIFVQPCRYDIGLHIGRKTVLVLLFRYVLNNFFHIKRATLGRAAL